MPSKSKTKERSHLSQVIPLFNSWWGEVFKHTPSSGALRWGGDGKIWTYADLVPPLSFPFCVECKFHENFDLDEVIRRPPIQGKITYYWYWQVVQDSLRATTELGVSIYPMLVYRQNKNTNRLVIQKDFYTRIPKDQQEQLPSFSVHLPGLTEFVVTDLKLFFTLVPRLLFERHLLGRSV